MPKNLANTLFLVGLAVACGKGEAPLSVALIGKPTIANNKVELHLTPPAKVGKDDALQKCEFCNQIASQMIEILTNFILNDGVPDSCNLLCGSLPKLYGPACDLMCNFVGLGGFLVALNKMGDRLDTIYFCEKVKQCREGPPNAQLSISEAIAQPSSVEVGSVINLGAVLLALNHTGVSTIQLSVQGPLLVETETALVPDGFAPGSQAVALEFPVQNTEAQTWTTGQYPFNVTICQGTCGSPFPGSINFGTVSGVFNVTETATQAKAQDLVVRTETPVVKSKAVLASQVGQVPFCEFCNTLSNQAVSTLINSLLNYGVPDSCEVLCSHVKPNLDGICSVVCEVVGISAFIKGLNHLNVDTIFLCEELHACKAGPDNAKVLVQSAIVQPTSVAIGGTIELGAVIHTQVATGVSEVEVVIGGIVETALVPDGFKVGQQAVSLQIPVQNSETVTWEAGLTNFTVSICQGTCGSKAPHSIVFGNVSGTFMVTETALTQATLVV